MLFGKLEDIYRKPLPFEVYTADSLWTDPYRSRQMLRFHLDGSIDVSSRNTQFLDHSSEWIVDRFTLRSDKSVCDFGCGPGLYTSRLARSGAQITGIDFSINSIEYAREQAVLAGDNISYVHGSYLDFVADKQFDLVTMIMCDYCALSPVQRQKLLAIWHACLKDDGAALLDVYSMAAFEERKEESFCERNQLNHFWHSEEYYVFVNKFVYEDELVVLDKYNIFPEKSRDETVYNWLQYFTLECLADELACAGFRIDQLCGNVAGDEYTEQSPEFAVVITKNT